MDRKLLIRGTRLLEYWEDLSLIHLHNMIRTYFPVAFAELDNSSFASYPNNFACTGHILPTIKDNSYSTLDNDYKFLIGWDISPKVPDMFATLYYCIVTSNKYLSETGHTLIEEKAKNWTKRLDQANSVALSLNEQYLTEPYFSISSEDYQKWHSAISDAKLRKSMKISLYICLKWITGMSVQELVTDFSRASASRDVTKGAQFICANRGDFSHLPCFHKVIAKCERRLTARASSKSDG